jgi:GT2 family glycosyltransferase
MSDQPNELLPEAERSAACGFVIIGRNEGSRLQGSLRSVRLLHPDARVVYVDSGSTDGSVAFALSIGVTVVELDMSAPFTAGRARNAGFRALDAHRHGIAFVHFLDGDCELEQGWLGVALDVMKHEPSVAVVSGRRVEKFPQRSIYNALMDIEWSAPPGDVKAVLGDMLVRTRVFSEVGGFNDKVMAAEDDDLCIRIRAAGYLIRRVAVPMSRHDANILRLGQWLRRSMRGGYGYANVYSLHGSPPENYFRRQVWSAVLWGGAVPAVLVASLVAYPPMALLPFFAILLSIGRTAHRRRIAGSSWSLALSYGAIMLVGKAWEMAGMVTYMRHRFAISRQQLIEYK